MIDYESKVIEGIEGARKISIEEFVKTDLNEGNDISEVGKWYDALEAAVRRKPPRSNVRKLEITEDEEENILEVNYVYSNEKDEERMTFTIKTARGGKEK